MAGPLDEHDENIEGSEADGDRNENTALVAPRQAVALAIQAEFLEQENVGRCGHAPVSRLSRGRRAHPVGLIESLSNGLRAALLHRFSGICRIFANFLSPFSSPTPAALRTLGIARMPNGSMRFATGGWPCCVPLNGR